VGYCNAHKYTKLKLQTTEAKYFWVTKVFTKVVFTTVLLLGHNNNMIEFVWFVLQMLILLFFLHKCFLAMQFLNPNAAGDMAQLLQKNQENYVPCLTNGTKKTIVTQIPLHGDQLFEERARNVIWTFRDGIDGCERLEGIETEFADWHAKYTLYKVFSSTIYYSSSTYRIGSKNIFILMKQTQKWLL